MTTLPPGPFEVLVTSRPDEILGTGHVYVTDAKGRKIASLWGSPAEKMAMAELVIKAREKE